MSAAAGQDVPGADDVAACDSGRFSDAGEEAGAGGETSLALEDGDFDEEEWSDEDEDIVGAMAWVDFREGAFSRTRTALASGLVLTAAHATDMQARGASGNVAFSTWRPNANGGTAARQGTGANCLSRQAGCALSSSLSVSPLGAQRVLCSRR
jgi:hypothetical protein